MRTAKLRVDQQAGAGLQLSACEAHRVGSGGSVLVGFGDGGDETKGCGGWVGGWVGWQAELV